MFSPEGLVDALLGTAACGHVLKFAIAHVFIIMAIHAMFSG